MTLLEFCIGVGCAIMSVCAFVYMVRRWDFRDDDGGKRVEI